MQDDLFMRDALQNMKDAGCNEEQVESFLHCLQQGDKSEELCILTRQRDILLDEIHDIHNAMEELARIIENMREETH